MQESQENWNEEEFGDLRSSKSSSLSDTTEIAEDASEAVRNWKERRRLEIEERDRSDAEIKERLQEEAVKHIDDFYEIYNKKKEQQLEQSKKDAEAFLKEREEFFNQDNTVWDRVMQLINVDDADVVGDRDRSKFKDILLRLQGNQDAPGVISKEA
ncbi:clathrin light chain CLC1 Ecym_8217 [Eremothecium cymbalariae DBVPG|uniref:Clathrin light chain n=1 Tax=Eremothecium cymbalariae (strain CBS 270.75 / DBVPG 7215 / KCTC 17166 / NRRL Y-17582) TaxID=931890 RepID=G8JXC8_ERECY|nr:Hypothetical protein Ecym_8217 [Eremothecium cymbalariae DBVPG\